MDRHNGVSWQTLQRLPLYLNYLRSLPESMRHVSSTDIAVGLGLHAVQVRKDLAAIGSSGRPRTGYETGHLKNRLTMYLSKGTRRPAILVGMGHLGRALARYQGFRDYGVELAGFFDNNADVIGEVYCGMRVKTVQQLTEYCKQLDCPIGILTVPREQAQGACNLLVAGGAKAIWNFAPIYLSVPSGITVLDEDIASSLALLTEKMIRTASPAEPGGGESA